ncbi:MAG TPA: protein kinase [Polyangiaceae bacterium]|nr:protein kinase [Polyangiaceae bacterium]
MKRRAGSPAEAPPLQTQVNVEHAGQVIAGLYRLEEQLGRGAMGRIWRAEHLRLRSKVAIKFLDASISGHPEAFERFMREAQSAAAVRSAHVVQVFDCGMDNAVPYISMELLEGESLDQRLSARGALSASELHDIFSGVAQAVDTAHELGVVHRDLKPGNIFITREREVEMAKVLDFGIAKLMNRTGEAAVAAGTGTGVMLGTPYYMSPEQVRGSRDLDQRTDLWSLAVIAFECLTGDLPFRGESVGDIVVQICTAAPTLPSALADVPPGFDEWFVKGTSKDPAGRFATARQMADALGAILLRVPARHDPTSPASGERPRTVVLSQPAPLPPSQSTGPMTAPIPLASDRAPPDPRARARRRNVGVAMAVALACAVGAAVSALPARRTSWGPESARSVPASTSRPLVEVRAPSAREGAAQAAVSDEAPAAGNGPPSAARDGSAQPELDATNLADPALVPQAAPSSTRARRGTSARAGKAGARGPRKHTAKKGKRRPAPTPPAALEANSDPDPFSDRQ